jgi:hypothetical protein
MWEIRKIFKQNVFLIFLYPIGQQFSFIGDVDPAIPVKLGKDDTAGVVDTWDAPLSC